MRSSALAGMCGLDLSRGLAGPWRTQTLADLGANRNKRSMTIDMSQPEGQALLLHRADT